MSKGTKVFVAVIFVGSVAFDFYLGYHQTRSVGDGIAHVLFGLVVLGLFLWLYSKRPSRD
jgi:hypothetical protein